MNESKKLTKGRHKKDTSKFGIPGSIAMRNNEYINYEVRENIEKQLLTIRLSPTFIVHNRLPTDLTLEIGCGDLDGVEQYRKYEIKSTMYKNSIYVKPQAQLIFRIHIKGSQTSFKEIRPKLAIGGVFTDFVTLENQPGDHRDSIENTKITYTVYREGKGPTCHLMFYLQALCLDETFLNNKIVQLNVTKEQHVEPIQLASNNTLTCPKWYYINPRMPLFIHDTKYVYEEKEIRTDLAGSYPVDSVFNFNEKKNCVEYHDILVCNFTHPINTKVGAITTITLLGVQNVLYNKTGETFSFRTVRVQS